LAFLFSELCFWGVAQVLLVLPPPAFTSIHCVSGGKVLFELSFLCTNFLDFHPASNCLCTMLPVSPRKYILNSCYILCYAAFHYIVIGLIFSCMHSCGCSYNTRVWVLRLLL
jgi:hypothetical protein